MAEPAPGPGRRPAASASTVEAVVGPALVARVHGLLRAVRLYDLGNRTLRDQLADMLGLLVQVPEDEVVLLAMGQCFYVNGARIRARGAQASYFEALTSEFEIRGLAGLRFLNGLQSEELVAFLRLFLDHADADRAAALGDAATSAGIAHVSAITRAEAGSGAEAAEAEAEPAPEQERDRALQTFRQAVAGTRGAILTTARTGKPALRKIKRIVQPIVDSIMKDEYSLVGLTAIKGHDEYTYAHCVNVGILSVAMGHGMGMSRAALADLGVAALLHDIGKLTIPADVLRKPDRMSEEEWTLMRRHPIEGMKMVSRVPGLTPLTADMFNVTFQHHLTSDGRGYPAVDRPSTLSVVARLVAVADCFDALTAHRAYRKRPFTGYEALRLLLGPDRGRYDPAALWALVNTVGLYPAGTLLTTNTGHLVVSLSPNPDDRRRPSCVVLARPDGTMPPDSAPETWNPMPDGVVVARVVDPDEFEGEVERLLAA